MAARPARKATVRGAARGLAGWARSTRPTARDQTSGRDGQRRTAAGRTSSRTAGSPTVGGSAGTGPWAERGRPRRASDDRRPAAHDGARPGPERDEALTWPHRRTIAASDRLDAAAPTPLASGRLSWRTFRLRPAVGPCLTQAAPDPGAGAPTEFEDLDVEPPGRGPRRTDARRPRSSAARDRCSSWPSGSRPGGPAPSAIWHSFFPPVATTSRAARSATSTTIVFVIAVAIFFVVEGLIVWTVLRYRRKPGDDELPPQTHGNNLAELVWTVVPTLIVIFLFFISWQTLNTVEATSTRPDLQVRADGRPVPVDVRLHGAGAKATDGGLLGQSTPYAPDGGLTSRRARRPTSS